MFFSPDKKLSVVGIDIGSSSVKLVELENKRDVIELSTYAEIATGPYAGLNIGEPVKLGSQKLEEVILDLYRESKAQSTTIVCSISMSDCQVLYIELPKSAESMVDTLLPIEARKYTTQSMNELRISYEPVVPVGKDVTNKIAYLVLLTKENQYNFIRDAISNALHVEDITIEPSIFGAVRMIPIEKLLTSKNANTPDMQLVIDIGARATTIACVIGGVLYGAQTIDDGMSDIVTRLRQSMSIDKLEAEKIMRSIHTLDQNDMSIDVVLYGLEHLIEKVIHILNSFKLRYTTGCDHVYITGGGSLLLMLSQMLTASLQLPVDAIDMTQRVHTPMVLHDIVHAQSAILVNAAGLAISQLE